VKDSFQGIIRAQDIRAGERDKIQVYKCYLPGDVVKAKVISLGDTRSYYLSTAENELGVILATSTAGHTLVPIDWERMVFIASSKTMYLGVPENSSC
jgi:exosome complex component CSL4